MMAGSASASALVFRRRAFVGLSLAVFLASSTTVLAAPSPNRASAGLSGNVIVVLRDQHTDLAKQA